MDHQFSWCSFCWEIFEQRSAPKRLADCGNLRAFDIGKKASKPFLSIPHSAKWIQLWASFGQQGPSLGLTWTRQLGQLGSNIAQLGSNIAQPGPKLDPFGSNFGPSSAPPGLNMGDVAGPLRTLVLADVSHVFLASMKILRHVRCD